LPFYLIGRFLAVVFLAALVFTTYKIAEKLTGNKVIGYLSAYFLYIGVWITHFSFYALSDIALTFSIMLSLYFSLKIVKDSGHRNYILAAIFAGFATSIKYTGFLACFFIVVAHLYRKKSLKAIFDVKLILSAIVSVVAFFVGTPYALLDFDTFMGTGDATGAFWQIRRMGFGANWFYHIFVSMPQNFGWLILIFAVVGIILFVKKRFANQMVFIISFFIIMLYVGTWGITRAHYTIPMFPFIAIFSAYATYYVYKKFNLKIYQLLLLIILLSAYPVINSTIEIIKRNRLDSRLVAGEWISANISKTDKIQMLAEKTLYYGGRMPFFEYHKFKVETPSRKKFDDAEVDYIVSNKPLSLDNNKKLIYYQDNYLRTGPIIYIYKVFKDLK